MTGVHGYEYAVLRAVPRPERDESVNVGVLLYCRALDYLRGAARVDADRLRALDPHVDVDAVAALVAVAAEVCALDTPPRADRRTDGALAASGPGVGEDLGRRFRRLTAPRSTVVRPGPVHTGLTTDPDAELDRLLRVLVLPVRGPTHERGRIGEPAPVSDHDLGVPPGRLTDDDLRRELAHLHETRHDTVLAGSESALETHTRRMLALEAEFVRRLPAEAAPDPLRTRAGRRHDST